MKHKHYEMILAKAANMDLVKFFKHEDNYRWVLSTAENFVFKGNCEYFLCLPQHKEACLHWLNGGELTIDNGKGFGASNYTLHPHHKPLTDFISHPEYVFRIAPKKEKRWIIAMKDGGSISLCGKQLHISKGSAIDFAELHGTTSHLQFIEIEIEV